MGSLPFGKDMLKKTQTNKKANDGNSSELLSLKDRLKPAKKNESKAKEDNKLDFNLKHVEKQEKVMKEEEKEKVELKHVDEKDEGTSLKIKLNYNGQKKKSYVIAKSS